MSDSGDDRSGQQPPPWDTSAPSGPPSGQPSVPPQWQSPADRAPGQMPPPPFGQSPYGQSSAAPPPQGQPPYGQSPYGPPQGQAPYAQGAYWPPPSYGAPPQMGPASRPGVLTAAAVLALVVATFTTLFALVILFAADALFEAAEISDADLGFLRINAMIGIAISAAFVWGAIDVLRDRSSLVITIAAAAAIAYNIVTFAVAGFDATGVCGFIIPVLILSFVRSKDSVAWMAQRRSRVVS